MSKKDIECHFRISEKEKKLLKRKAEEANISQSEFLRQLICNEKVMVYNHEVVEVIQKLIYEVNKIGVNINQIAHHVNSGQYSDYEKKKLFAMHQKLSENVLDIIEEYYDTKNTSF